MSLHTHFLTFEGKVPADEMERAKLFANDEVLAAKNALLAAFKKAGVVYTAASKIVCPRAMPAPRLPE